MGKLLILFLFNIQFLYGFSVENYFQNETISFKDAMIAHLASQKLRKGDYLSIHPLIKEILSDPKDIIDKNFIIDDYHYQSVYFWFIIYTLYPSSNIVIHDIENLGLVYDVLDFSNLFQAPIKRKVKILLNNKFSREKILQIRSTLKELAKNYKHNTPLAKKIRWLVLYSGYKIPENRNKRRKFFLKLSRNIRTQTGQRDMIIFGIVDSQPYLDFIEHHFKNFKLHTELLAIPFLESSFNPRAKSKVGASGIWQFMKGIARLILPMDRYTDSRNNPFLSTIGAFHLLKQNYQILKRWDLAITAYNSGPTHLIKARRKLRIKKKDLSLEKVFENYKSTYHGFASRNFFPSFLALVYALNYKNFLYPIEGIGKESLTNYPKLKNYNVKFYISLCKIRPQRIFNKLKELKKINTHILRPKRVYPRGTIIVSDRKLSSRKYFLVSDKNMKKYYPKNWKKYIRRKRCKR